MVAKGWGRIVNFAGMNAIHGHAGRAPVSVAKHGVWGLTKALAMEFGPKGITTNTISPGPIAPDVEEKNASAQARAQTAGPRPARPLRHAGRGRRRGAAAGLGGRRLHQRPDDPGERRRRDLTVGERSERVRDYLAWRLAFGVTTPSTNTVVQPEYDDMRPAGRDQPPGRMVIADDPVTLRRRFRASSSRLIDKSLEDAVDRVMDAKPNAFILGISALSVWGGTLEWGEELKRRVRKVAGWDIPVALASDAVVDGLKAHGVKKKIADHGALLSRASSRGSMRGVLGPHGYEIVRFNHMRGKSPASYSVLTAQDMIKAIKLDRRAGHRGDRAVRRQPAVGQARRRSRALARQAGDQINATTYWHALRMNGITDKLYGYGSLLARF